jgi:beta-aspartyl-dipeptidase (metallo-type)
MDIGSPAAMARALEELLECGQPLERVLPAFTSNPAGLLRLPRKGHLMPGLDADLVVLDPDGGIESVMARGNWHVVDRQAVRRGVFEARQSGGGVR